MRRVAERRWTLGHLKEFGLRKHEMHEYTAAELDGMERYLRDLQREAEKT